MPPSAPPLLPVWVQYVQAVCVPVVGVVIAATGAWIARQQMRLARVKLVHDLFDRRFKVFDTARKLLEEIVVYRSPSPEMIDKYKLGVAEAPFLFGLEIVGYLKSLGDEASLIAVLRISLPDIADPYVKGDTEAQLSRLIDDIDAKREELVAKFTPFLRL